MHFPLSVWTSSQPADALAIIIIIMALGRI
jgi:hypothetical protein